MKRPQMPKRLSSIHRRVRPHITRKRLALASLLMLIVLLAIPIGTYAYFSKDISDKERLMNRNSTGFILLDKNGETLYSYGRTSHQNQATLSEISDFTEGALIASEDEEFYKHDGFSLRGIASALRTNLLSGDATRQGGSTITQQLVKNNLLTTEKSYLRKYQEISMAIAIERHYEKEEILEMYLNSVYFGEGAFGIEQAAQTYFNKSAQDLSLAESSMLVGLLPAPSSYSPISGDTEKAESQQARVLRRMAEAGQIDEATMATAEAEGLAYNQSTVETQKFAQHFTTMVIQELNQKYDEETIIRSGFEVTTTLDLEWQKQAEASVTERINDIRDLGATNAGLVAIDPRSGEIRALVGSANWDNPEFGKVNMAMMPRQPGSSFKPLFYAEAMEQRLITPATVLDDKPKTYGGTYEPENYDRKFRGEVKTRDALAQSLNLPAVEVMQKLGAADASTAAQRMGVSDVNEPDKYGLSLALGTAETKLLDMTNAYAAFANQGGQFEPTIISSIRDKFDREVFTAQKTAKQVMSPEASFLVSSILSDNNAREPVFGNRLNIRNRQVAVKTGTTNDNRDAWTIGYTPSLAIGVWVGDNANRPMNNIAGSSGAAPIWSQTMSNLLGSSRAETFTQPEGVVKAKACQINTGTYDEFFIKGTEPDEKSCRRQPEPQPEPEAPDVSDEREEAEKEAERLERELRRQRNDRGEEGGRGSEDEEDEEEDPTPPTEPEDPEDGDETTQSTPSPNG